MVTTEEVLTALHFALEESQDIGIPIDQLAATPWVDTGLESLALMELVLHLEQQYHQTVSNAALRTIVTFGDLARLFGEGAG